jgi:hypothetical protein
MRITPDGDSVEIAGQSDDSHELLVIATKIMPEWLALFARKNRDYGSGSAYELGVRGQYSDIHRKMIKLKRAMWDGEQLDFEDTEEIIKDLISHLFLTLHMFGLQREAEQAYVYTEDDAAVDAFFRMVGGDAENALKMSGVLTHPFRELVRERAARMLGEQQAEAEYAASMSDGEDVPRRASIVLHEVVDAMRRDGATRERAWEGAREARRRGREADGSPGEAELSASRKAGAYGFRADGADESPLERLMSEEFAHGDFEQNAKVGPARIVTEQVDGRIRYYHEPYPGADREPMSLVPTALIERAQKDHHVMSKEQEAGLSTLADWANRQ